MVDVHLADVVDAVFIHQSLQVVPVAMVALAVALVADQAVVALAASAVVPEAAEAQVVDSKYGQYMKYVLSFSMKMFEK